MLPISFTLYSGLIRVCENIVGCDSVLQQLLDAGAERDRGNLASVAGRPIPWALTAPAMGDREASEVAEIACAHCLREYDCVREHEWMTYGFPPPRERI
jgi:hypothetical protein